MTRFGMSTKVKVMVAIVVGFGGGWWAAGTVMGTTSQRSVGPRVPTTYQVKEGTVSQEILLNAVGEWSKAATLLQQGEGTVTTIDVAPGAEVVNGSRIFSVGLKPVVAFEGEVPSFRTLTLGIKGPDVLQLTKGLVALRKLKKGRDAFDETVASAVRSWQKQLGVEQTGSVEPGDVVFVPSLPRRVRLADDVKIGASIAAGDKALVLLDPAPQFRVPITSQQRQRIPDGTKARVRHPEGEWEGVISGIAPKPAASEEGTGDETGTTGSDPTDGGAVDLLLTAPDGGSICADKCALVPTDDKRSFSVTLVLVPETRGLVVPIAALRTGADGDEFVEDSTGKRFPIKVVIEAKGMAVVEGVRSGLRVRITDEG